MEWFIQKDCNDVIPTLGYNAISGRVAMHPHSFLPHSLIAVFVGMTLFLAASTAQGADAKAGQKLYEKNCTGCHDTSIHTRGDKSIIHSLSALKKRIKFCESMAKAGWGESQLEDVAAYLNTHFYKFPK